MNSVSYKDAAPPTCRLPQPGRSAFVTLENVADKPLEVCGQHGERFVVPSGTSATFATKLTLTWRFPFFVMRWYRSRRN